MSVKHPHKSEILPASGWQAVQVGELWRFRELFYFLIWRDVKVRYRQTVLGAAWAILQPAMMMLVFIIFLGVIAGVQSARDPVFVYAGMLPWTFFATALTSAAGSLIANERLITKIYFPRLTVPLSAIGAATIDFVIALSVLVVMMVFKGVTPGIGILFAPLIFALLALGAAGVGTLLAALTVMYRDFRYIVPFIVQVWLFATPSAYSSAPGDLGAWFQTALLINPVGGLIASFRAAMFNQPLPWAALGIATIQVAVIFLVGCLYFRRVEDNFADIV